MGLSRFVIAISCCLVVGTTSVVMAVEDSFPRRTQITRERSAKPPKRDKIRLSLEQTVQLTLSRNPKVGEALSRIRQRVWQQQEVYSDFFPSAPMGSQGTWFRYGVGGGFGPPDHMSRSYKRTLENIQYPYRVDPWKRFSGTIAVAQPIYQGGQTVANFNSAKLQVTNSELQLQVDMQDLILAVYQAYYTMMLAEKLLEVNSESIGTLNKLKSLNEKFLRAGTVTKTDVLSTESQLYSAYVEQRSLVSDIEVARATLNNLLSNPPETPVEVEQNYNQRSNPYRVPQIYNTAMTNRDEIVQATNEIRRAIEATKVANAALLPNVSLLAQGTRTNDDWNVLDPEGNNDWTLTAVLTWTFNLFRNNSTVKEKREAVNELVFARQRLVQDISQNVKIAYLNMKTSEGNIDDYRRAVAVQSENFRLFQMRYQQGDVSFTDVLIAENQLVAGKANYYRSLIDYRINQAILERVMGILRR
jgi:outer membrane protein TolC